MLRRRLGAQKDFGFGAQFRSIIIPKQLKAYGAEFSKQDRGERGNPSPVPLLQNVKSLYNHAPLSRRTAMIDDFSEMSLDISVRKAMEESFAITTPSPIQQLAVPAGTDRNVAVVVASPSGTGKTLACLAPAYSNMVRDRDTYKIPAREFRPRMIVLAPTREILRQTRSVCKRLDDTTGLRSVVMTRTNLMKRKMKRLLRNGKPIDVLVMHPHMVLKLIRHRRLFLDDLRYLVVDEADEMLGSEQDYFAQQLIAKIQKRYLYKHLPPVDTQIYFSTTNITRPLSTYINRKFPYAVHCVTNDVHKAPENVKFRFFPVPKEEGKLEMLEFILNRKTKNYPLLPMNSETDVQRAQQGDVPLKGAVVSEAAGGGDASVVGMDEGEEMTYKEWLKTQKALKEDGAPSNSDALATSEGSKALATATSFVVPGMSTANPDAFAMAATSSTPKSVAASRRDREVRDRLRSEVSKALAIPTTRQYGSAGLVRPAVRWQNVLTHASPFQFHIPQTFVPQSGLRVMVFTRSIDSCAAIYFKLKGLGYGVSLMHASLPETVRNEMLERFASGRCNILICTNVMARGVDIPVDIVINFDLPRNASTFLHRAGRCGRMGRVGTCYSIVHAKRERVMTSALNALIHSGVGLHGVSNVSAHMNRPRYSEWSTHHKNQLAKAYVGLISKSSIPRNLVKTYIRHNAMWRPLFRPNATGVFAGVAPRQQDKIMASVMRDAITFRKQQLAKRKGGAAKFGSKGGVSAPWSWKGASYSQVIANSAGSEKVANSVAPVDY